MDIDLTKVSYKDLNSKQKENYNLILQNEKNNTNTSADINGSFGSMSDYDSKSI